MNALPEQEMYEAVIRNDASYDGLFFYGVKSTGIFCRPSCPSKDKVRIMV
jgi:methylphosphotriester-DNA--protein-cysteine methyltransferase